MVVATHVNELKDDYVREEPFSPFLRIGGNGEQLADLVAHYRTRADERLKLVNEAFAHVRTLTWRRNAQGYLDFWNRSATSLARTSWCDRASLAMQLCAESA